ncbi:hypothetical protein [Ilumatobacter coccineus]|uniref:Uncharacterized protein n=1 Tax=Ilumatobacter coccineus (strain NBRC 103263 / KCTC 29153 / YM16-304) TaxID=1313172 RepID=A0A6C7E6P7_ILUCY|nr:hypothetical protein [Ilumatobacter coccineus]BAN00855.1 hypothetical protein YM304_05410 [Ilumatobacter coccineus YM16-304]
MAALPGSRDSTADHDRLPDRPTGWVLGAAVGVGSSLSATVGSVTGDWSRASVVLAACISLGAIAALRIGRGSRRTRSQSRATSE